MLVRRAGRSYTGCMMRSLPDSKQAVRSAARRLGAWTRRPFDTGYRWGLPLALYAGLCLAYGEIKNRKRIIKNKV